MSKSINALAEGTKVLIGPDHAVLGFMRTQGEIICLDATDTTSEPGSIFRRYFVRAGGRALPFWDDEFIVLDCDACAINEHPLPIVCAVCEDYNRFEAKEG